MTIPPQPIVPVRPAITIHRPEHAVGVFAAMNQPQKLARTVVPAAIVWPMCVPASIAAVNITAQAGIAIIEPVTAREAAVTTTQAQ